LEKGLFSIVKNETSDMTYDLLKLFLPHFFGKKMSDKSGTFLKKALNQFIFIK
jgi:hypothetical protein